MTKRKWYERASAAVLAAVLVFSSNGMGLQSRAEIMEAENAVIARKIDEKVQSDSNAVDAEKIKEEETILRNTASSASRKPSACVITGFETLSDEILSQQLPLGSAETDIQFPDTLEITVREATDKSQELSRITWQLDPELSVYPEFHGGISQEEYFTEFDEDGAPIETEERTYADYARENEPYSGAVYIYRAVLPEEDNDGRPVKLADGVEIPEIYVTIGEAETAVYAAEGATYTVSGTANSFTVSGSINQTFNGENAVGDAFNAILSNSADRKATINFNNVNITEDNAFPVINENCELTLTGSYTNVSYAFDFKGDGPFIIHSSANIVTGNNLFGNYRRVEFEQNGGTVTVGDQWVANFDSQGKYVLKNGTVNGAIGGYGDFVMDSGTLNGYINGPKSITINGGNINTTSGPGFYVYSVYLQEGSELHINGGSISATGLVSGRQEGPAIAIVAEKNATIALKNEVDITAKSANNKPSASIWYYDSEDQKVIDATEVTGFTNPLTIAARSDAMKNISPFANWIEGKTENIDTIKNKTQFKVFTDTSGTEDTAYSGYEPKVSNTYIRMQDKNNQLPDIVSGDIPSVLIARLGDTEYGYSYSIVGQDDLVNGKINTNEISLNNLIAAILAADTTYGCELNVITNMQLQADDITVDTTGTCITLNGKITGRVNVIGTGTIVLASIEAAGVDGNTASTIEVIRGSKIISTNGSAISLSHANLKVRDGAVITDNSTSGSGIYAINASGPVTVDIEGGTITSTNNAAVNLFMLGEGSDYASLNMSGGQVSGKTYGIRQHSSGNTRLTGGMVYGESADIFFEGDFNSHGQLVVENEIPFSTVSIIGGSAMSNVHMDLTNAFCGTGKSLQINLPSDNVSRDTNIKLFRVLKSNYRELMKHVSFSAGSFVPIWAVKNESQTDTETDIYVFWNENPSTGMYWYVNYFAKSGDTKPIYKEYLLQGSFLSSVDLNTEGETLAGWKKEDGTRIADDYQINAENLNLYPAYKVTLTANVGDTDKTESSAVIKGTSGGETVYCVDSVRYESSGSGMTAAEIVNAGKQNDSYVKTALVDSDGGYSLSVTELSPYTEYTYYLATENTNGDYSNVTQVTFRTMSRKATAGDFRIAQTTFVYTGRTIAERGIPEMVSPKNGDSFRMVRTYYKLKNEEGSYGEEEIESPVNAGIYGVFIIAESNNHEIGRAANLLVGDITIEKADLNSNWFKLPVKTITYGEDDSDDKIRPQLLPSYQSRISGYGKLEFKLYKLSDMTGEVSRNSEGHYDATPDTYYNFNDLTVGITCTGGENVNPQKTPIPVGDYENIYIYRGTNQISLTCDSITYGQRPDPKVNALDTSYGVSYTYSQNRDDDSSYRAWNVENTVGTWYVKAKTARTLNYKETESEPAEFQVTKGTLVPVVRSIESKTYDGNTTAAGTLGLIAAEGSVIPAGDQAAVDTDNAVSGTFSWTSDAAGTNTVDVTNITLSDNLASKYTLSTDQLSGETFGDARILPAKVDENDIGISNYSGVYDGEEHGIMLFLKGSTQYELTFKDKDGNYTLTRSEWPYYTNAGDHIVEFRLTNENHEPYYGSGKVSISPAPLTVKADNKTVTYKDDAPACSYTATGFVHGEDESVLEEITNYDCAYTAESDAGQYEIMPYGFVAKNGNYDISYQPGTLTVEQAEPKFYLTNLEELNRVYEAKAVAPQVDSDSDGKLTVIVSKGTEILQTAPTDAGTYTVKIVGEDGKNYKAGEAEYSFRIEKAPLTVTASDQKIEQGSTIPEYTVTYQGLQGTDDEHVLGGKLQISCEYTAASPVGEYVITPSGLTSDNYEIQYVKGTLYVERRASHGSEKSDSSDDYQSNATSNDKSWSREEKGWRLYYKNGSYAAGKMVKDANGSTRENMKWVKLNGKWWPFGADGYLKTGWVLDGTDNRWYQIDENSGMRTGWYFDQSDDKNWYYLDPVSGAMMTGWQFINGKWYYFAVTSAAPQWKYDPVTGKWTFDSKSSGCPYGAMYQKTLTPDGYYVDKNGAWDGQEKKNR